MESKKISQLATELTPSLSDLTIIGDPTTGISKKITLSQMASLFTGTVEEYANLAAFPLVGVADTIYIALDTNVIYRYDTSLSAYVILSPNIINSLVFSDANGFDGTITLVGSVATLSITTALTLGSVPFIGASGALSQDNSNLFFDDTNNRLGIATASPTTPLDVFGSGIIGRLNATSTNNSYLGFASNGTNKWSAGNVQSDHRFRIFSEANSAELITILQTGEFGIGIANPLTKLHIDGGATALIANLDANVSVAKSVSFRSDNSSRINLEVSGTESGSNAGADFFLRTFTDAGSLLATPLTITRSTGAATFSSSVTAKDLIISDTYANDPLISLATTTSGNVEVQLRTATTTYNAGIGVVTSGFDFNIFTNNTSRLIISSTGNIGIGTTPSTWNSVYKTLQIGASMSLLQDGSSTSSYWGGNLYVGTDGNYRYTITGNGGLFGIESGSIVYYGVASGTAGNIASLIERFNVGTSSSFKIYTSSGTSETLRLICADTIGDGYISFFRTSGVRKAYLGYAGSNDDNFTLMQEENAPIIFGTNSTERMRIASGGWTKISNNATYGSTASNTHEINSSDANWALEINNRNAAPYGLHIAYPSGSPNGNDNWFIYADDSTTLRFGVKSNGNVVNSNNSYGPISDIKLKENIVDTTPKLEDLLKVRIVNYNLISDPDLKQIGVIAQELEQIFPGLVDEHQDIDRQGNDLGTTTKSVKMSVFVPMLIKAMQEQQAQIEELKAKIK